MCQLCEAIRQKGTILWKNQSWILHYDNAPAQLMHRCLYVSFWPKTKQYSPNLTPGDFFLFPKLNTLLKGKCFATIKQIKGKKTVTVELWKNQSRILHYDNAPAQLTHRCLRVSFRPNTKRYSPDWTPGDFFLFPKLKTPLKGKCFAMIGEIREKKTGTVSDIKKRVSEKTRFEDLKKRWHKWIISVGDYF